MAQSIITDRLLFFAVHFEGFTENYPFLFEGLQNILKGMWRVGPQNKGNNPSILFHALELLYGQLALESINSDDIERVFCCHLRNMQSRHHRLNKFGSKWCVKHAIKASPGSIRFVKLAETIAKIRERKKKAMLNPKVRHTLHACTSL